MWNAISNAHARFIKCEVLALEPFQERMRHVCLGMKQVFVDGNFSTMWTPIRCTIHMTYSPIAWRQCWRRIDSLMTAMTPCTIHRFCSRCYREKSSPARFSLIRLVSRSLSIGLCIPSMYMRTLVCLSAGQCIEMMRWRKYVCLVSIYCIEMKLEDAMGTDVEIFLLSQ